MKDTRETAKDYTDWMVKTGGFARDKTLRDEFAGLAMNACMLNSSLPYSEENAATHAKRAYQQADAMLKERAK
jgi:hypothetical protein